MNKPDEYEELPTPITEPVQPYIDANGPIQNALNFQDDLYVFLPKSFLVYHETLGKWSCPCELKGLFLSAFAVKDSLYIATTEGVFTSDLTSITPHPPAS